MNSSGNSPHDVARALAARSPSRPDAKSRPATNERSRGTQKQRPAERDGWKRQSFTLPRLEARAKAREWFGKFPKAAYMTEIEYWRELGNDQIEFTIRRLPSAD